MLCLTPYKSQRPKLMDDVRHDSLLSPPLFNSNGALLRQLDCSVCPVPLDTFPVGFVSCEVQNRSFPAIGSEINFYHVHMMNPAFFTAVQSRGTS